MLFYSHLSLNISKTSWNIFRWAIDETTKCAFITHLGPMDTITFGASADPLSSSCDKIGSAAHLPIQNEWHWRSKHLHNIAIRTGHISDQSGVSSSSQVSNVHITWISTLCTCSLFQSMTWWSFISSPYVENDIWFVTLIKLISLVLASVLMSLLAN